VRKIRGQPDEKLQEVVERLRAYEVGHPKAKIDVYRQNDVSVWIRIIDPAFRSKDLVERDEEVWRILDPLPASVRSDVTMLLLLTPAEARTSPANHEFEHPTPCPPELLELIEKTPRRNGRRNAAR
jgi:hypothetical protein